MHELNDWEKWVGFFIICDFTILRPSWVGLSSEHQLLCFALKSPKKKTCEKGFFSVTDSKVKLKLLMKFSNSSLFWFGDL